ncbi:MAG: YacL family protein [Pontibacterium sp.]
MDYKFEQGLTGDYQAEFSMGHEALGVWLSAELKDNSSLIEPLLKAIKELKQGLRWDYETEGYEYNLQLSRNEACVRAHCLEAFDDSGIEDGFVEESMDYYDSESFASCGLDDFEALLLDWISFVGYAQPGNAV